MSQLFGKITSGHGKFMTWIHVPELLWTDIVEIIIIAIAVAIISFLFSLIGFKGYTTEGGTFETTLVLMKNIFSKDGIKYILNNSHIVGFI